MRTTFDADGNLVVRQKEKNNRHGLMVNHMKKIYKYNWTFFLCYPGSIDARRSVGNILTAIEKIGLNIIGMRLMCGSAKFLNTHFSRDGRSPGSEHLTRYPFIVMILEGEDAVNKALQITSEGPAKLDAYTSDSYESALEDYELWFATDFDDWDEKVRESTHLVCAFPDGTQSGPTDEVMENLIEKELILYPQPRFADNFYTEDLTFVLIRPLAFQKRCVGELVSIIENNVFHLKGLKLVRRSEFPHSDAWDANPSLASEIEEDEYGISMVVDSIEPGMINILKNGDGIVPDKDTEGINIGSNLIYLGKPGDREIIGEFFEFGIVSWVDAASGVYCGGYLAATLSSLQFEEYQA